MAVDAVATPRRFTVEVHCEPAPDGYREVRLVTGVATLALQAFPDVTLRTTEIFA